MKNKFDLVVCLEVIEHVFNSDKLFQFFNLLLKDKGHLLISTPNTGSVNCKLFYLLRGYPYGENHHVRFFNIKKLNQYAFFNGFDFVASNNYFSFSIDLIKRGFKVKNNSVSYVLSIIFLGLPYLLKKLNLFDCFSSYGIVTVFKKSTFPPLGLEVDNLQKNFVMMPEQLKELWLERLKKYLKKDNLKEHIHLKSYLSSLLKSN